MAGNAGVSAKRICAQKLSKSYVTRGVGQKHLFWLTVSGHHWALKAKSEHEERSGHAVDAPGPGAARGLESKV